MSNRCVVGVGENLGYDIVGVTPQNFHREVLRDCDLAIVNNFFEFNPAQAREVLEVLWGAGKPYVKYEHDSREIGRLGLSKRLFGESILNVFLSPAHLENHRAKIGCEGIALPLAIQTDLFRPVAGVERVPGRALIVGGWNKGGKTAGSLQRFIREHSDMTFVSVGFGVPGCEALPHFPLKEMPAIYSAAEYLVHHPDIICAGERVIFEAALCGAKVEMNGNVGHKSWKRDLSDTEGLREWLRQAPFDFWKAVDVALRGRVAA